MGCPFELIGYDKIDLNRQDRGRLAVMFTGESKVRKIFKKS